MMRFIRQYKKTVAFVVALAMVAGYIGWQTLEEFSAVNAAYIPLRTPRFHLAVDAYENLEGILSYRRTAHALVEGKTDDIEKITALNTWAHNHVRSIYTQFPQGVIDDNFYNILRRGHGYCDQIAHVFATLGYFAGYKTRLFMLKNPDTRKSPHTLAQVWLDNQWRFVEPYLGVVPLTSQRRLVSMEDLQREPSLLIKYYQQSGVPLSFADFPEGYPFYTFPYIGFSGFVKKVFSRRWVSYSAPTASPVAGETKAEPEIDTAALEKLTILYDRARRLHLDGHFVEAHQLYARLLSQNGSQDLREDAMFFDAFAFYEEKNFTEAIKSWDQLITSRPNSLWTPSAHYFAGESCLKIGEIEKARIHFQSANVPLARLRYLSLSQPSPSLHQTSGLVMP